MPKAVKRYLEGQRFERWLVLSEAGRDVNSRVIWNCVCDCGREKTLSSTSLVSGGSKSCGCLRDEKARQRSGEKAYNYLGGFAVKGSVAWANDLLTNARSRCRKARYAEPIGSSDDVIKFWNASGGKCMATGQPFSDANRPCLDHDHVTGQIRGFIGDKVNRAIGLMGDNAYSVLRAYQYLQGCELRSLGLAV